jgi:hypothetical protein
MYWTFMAEALRGKQSFATAGTAVADEADLILNVLAKLDQVLFARFMQQFLTFSNINATGIIAANQRSGHRIEGHADIHFSVAGPVLM